MYHVCISYGPYDMYPYIIFYFSLHLFLGTYCPWFYFFPFVWFLTTIRWKLLGGVCIRILSYTAICVFWNMCTQYNLSYIISLARIVRLSMWYFDNVCVLACHSICIPFLYVSVRHIVCHFAFCHLSCVSSLIHDLPFYHSACQLMPIT